jgi:hypothetical protein
MATHDNSWFDKMKIFDLFDSKGKLGRSHDDDPSQDEEEFQIVDERDDAVKVQRVSGFQLIFYNNACLVVAAMKCTVIIVRASASSEWRP